MDLTSYFIDTHSHLYLPEFDNDRDKVIERAVHNGVRKILLPNIDHSSIASMNDVVLRFPGVCYPMIGLHPTSVKDNFREELDIIENELRNGQYTGIGEIGIDLYWDKGHLKEQCLAFVFQLDLALKHKLPVAIHARESFNEIMEILEGYRNKELRGIFHAFTGTLDTAGQAVDMGFKLGIGGIITYKNSTLPELVHETDLHSLVLETDAPYLTPVPFRGKRNESGYIPYIAETIQQIKKVTLDEVATITTQNALEIFSLNHG